MEGKLIWKYQNEIFCYIILLADARVFMTNNDDIFCFQTIGKQEKKKWLEKLEPQRQKYIEDYTVFVRGLDKEELEMYTELKQKRDEEEEARRQNESSDSDSDDTSDESDDDSDSDSESDSDMQM